MNSETCIQEQQFLKNYLSGSHGRDFWLTVEGLFSSRYLRANESWPITQLQHNFPDALSNMISLVLSGDLATFATELMQLQKTFEQPESCNGQF